MDNSILYMQQQAEQRVRRMQEQARRVLEQEEEAAHLPTPSAHASAQPAPPAKKPASGGSEQWMLLVLALLLHQSGARPELLIALLYLAL